MVFKRKYLLPLLLTGASLWGLANFMPVDAPGDEKLPEKIDFNFHIRPILSDRCFACHGPDEKKREAGLRFDMADSAFVALGEKKDHYAIVKGHPEKSTLIERIFSTNPDSVMPPPASHLMLTERERKLLYLWIKQGAPWDKHWAFKQAVKNPLPKVKDKRWPRNEIDYFTLAEMENHGLHPSDEAGKLTLLRRVSFDLTGLPPSPEMIDRMLADESPEAFEHRVDELLASHAYGERMAMYWLDLARYSDTHGYQDDLPRTMWPWRDWVIKAFNENMPYDKFVTWQLAGDLLSNANKEQLLASAFNRNHKITQEGGVIDEEYRLEYVADRTNTFGKAFLGLTMECARCHDHKYDPIPTASYYSVSAFFNNVPEVGFVPNLAVPEPYMPITMQDLEGVLSFLNTCETVFSQKDTILQMIMKDNPPEKSRKTYILKRGQYDQPTKEVTVGVPEAILPFDQKLPKNRLGLSEWLFDPRNPLTARVMVNRLWQEMFGRGLVGTSDNFGMQGSLPTHPELLDWLAVEFQEHHWDIKYMLRLMVTSATYRQQAVQTAALQEKDPENKWLAHGPGYRMPYEFIRDNFLSASGLLVDEIGGPSVKPYQPPGLWEEIATSESADNFRGEGSYHVDTSFQRIYRRSLYTYNRRTIPPPTHLAFDAPIRDNCEVTRARTSTPLQALIMLNDPQVLEACRVLAARLMEDSTLTSPAAWIDEGFSRILTRPPTKKELQSLIVFFENNLKVFEAAPDKASALLDVGRYPHDLTLDKPKQAALMLTVSAIFNLSEAVEKT